MKKTAYAALIVSFMLASLQAQTMQRTGGPAEVKKMLNCTVNLECSGKPRGITVKATSVNEAKAAGLKKAEKEGLKGCRHVQTTCKR